jgi:hypothetical protein
MFFPDYSLFFYNNNFIQCDCSPGHSESLAGGKELSPNKVLLLLAQKYVLSGATLNTGWIYLNVSSSKCSYSCFL